MYTDIHLNSGHLCVPLYVGRIYGIHGGGDHHSVISGYVMGIYTDK